MKHISKGPEPTVLQQYKARNPNNTWQQFRRDINRLKPVQAQIKEDQGHLCAYCEIDLLGQTPSLQADFRVEHFHPKSDTSSPHNWALDWNNLLGCCHGGTRRDVQESLTRFKTPDAQGKLPKCYSSIRSYLGKASEAVISQTNSQSP